MLQLRQWCARQLRRWADWLAPIIVVPLVDPALVTAACGAVLEAEATPHTSSYRRAMAMKQLMGQFPDTPRRDLSLAIELAVRQVVPL